MKCIVTRSVLLLAAMAIVPELQAVEVTPGQARTAARNWVMRSPARMGAAFQSSNVEATATVRDDSGRPICHAVNFKGGGFVVTSADTEINPIVAFSTSGELDISEGNPFLEILKADMSGRLSAIDDEAHPSSVNAAAAKASSGGRVPVGKCHETAWAELIGFGDGAKDSKADDEPEDPAAGIDALDDVRVAPMVKAEWNQSGTWNGNYIYNLYTPNHYVCGCTATAVAQIMRYWEYPKTYLPKRTVECKVDGVAEDCTTIGGTYNWSDMPLTFADINSVRQCEMIGRLSYDVGVVSEMSWKKGGSGASLLAAAIGLVDYFEYADADAVNAGPATGNLTGSGYANGVLGSLDAGMPAVLAVYKRDGDDYKSGHSVVADGYGYHGNCMYLHINIGYARSDWNIWYNLFGEAFVAGSHEWDYVWTSIVNIHPTVVGHVVSGRVLSSGVPVAGATVRLYDSSNALVASTTSNAKGIYSFRIPVSGQYVVVASKATMTSSSVSVDMRNLPVGGAYERGGATGNKWGVDLTLDLGDEWDHGDDTATGGTWLTPKATVQTHGPHTVSSSDEYDFFRISMTAGVTYVFESTSSSDMYGELFDSTSANSESRVAYNDDDGEGRNFKIEYKPTKSQTYYLRVKQYFGSDASYSLKYSSTAVPQTYKVTFGKNGGTGGSAQVTATYGAAMPTATAPTLSGWTFAGYWDSVALDEKGNPKGKQYYDTNMKSVRSWDKKGDATLWAKWTNKVTLGKNGGSGGDAYVTCTKGQPMPTRTMPTKTGYAFAGYWTTVNAGGVKYYNADGTSAHTWDKSGNVTLWAKWETAVTVKVTLGKNGGSGGDNYVTCTTGKPMPTPRTAPTRAGWTFAGYWDTLAQDANGNPTGKQYYDKDMKSVRNWDKPSAVTLWAKWTVKVKLGKNGGSGGDDTVTVTYNQPFPKKTMPKRTGYTFGGYWVSASSKTGRCYNTDGTGTSTMKWTTGGTPTIWALWISGKSATKNASAPVGTSAFEVCVDGCTQPPTPDAASPWPAGLYTGVVSGGTGVFALDVDDEGATLIVESDGGCVVAECVILYYEDGVVVVMTDEGGVFRLILR